MIYLNVVKTKGVLTLEENIIENESEGDVSKYVSNNCIINLNKNL